MFERSNFVAGDRVMCEQFSASNRAATFIEYGPANIACPDTHLSTPGMRIAYVNNDRFGRLPVWERRLVAA
jgi:hypothetical protein